MKKTIILTVLLIAFITGTVYGQNVGWIKIGNGAFQVIQQFLFNANETDNKKMDQGIISNDSTLKEYSVKIPDLGEVKEYKIKYENKSGEVKLLGFVEENIGIRFDVNASSDLIVFSSQSNDLWLVDNQGKIKKISNESLNNVNKTSMLEKNSNSVWEHDPKFVPGKQEIIFRSSVGESGADNQNTNLWIMNVDGNNCRMIFNGSLPTTIIGWNSDNQAIIFDGQNIFSYDIEALFAKPIASKVNQAEFLKGSNILFYIPSDTQSPVMRFYNLENATQFEIKNIPDGLVYNGFFDCSPDNNKIAFLTSGSKTALVIASLIDGSLIKIVDSPEGGKFFDTKPITWLDNNTISVTLTEDMNTSKSESWLVIVE